MSEYVQYANIEKEVLKGMHDFKAHIVRKEAAKAHAEKETLRTRIAELEREVALRLNEQGGSVRNNDKQRKLRQCVHCGIAGSLKKIARHESSCGEKLPCNFCGQEFVSRVFAQHQQACERLKTLKCECGKVGFKREYDFTRH